MPFEVAQPRHGGSPVARAAGSHHGAGPQLRAVGERDVQGAVDVAPTAIQRRGLRRNEHLGTELLLLHIGPAGQRLARDAGRKAEVVLDAHAGPGLAAISPAIEHYDAQAPMPHTPS
jgi:hypothetical protein